MRWLFKALVGASLALGAATLPLGHGGDAHAAVSIEMSLDELVGFSARVVVAQPVERKSSWEESDRGKRIVTYTRLVIEETVAGDERSEVWVRTLGGKVDKIGQQVSGEAVFKLGERTMVFLEDVGSATVVTGMAQGHFRLKDDGGELVLVSSPDVGSLLPRRGPSIAAREILIGKKLAPAATAVREAWKRRGNRK